jgi:hypothetical protein
MPNKIEFPFADDEALPTIPITLSYCLFSAIATRDRNHSLLNKFHQVTFWCCFHTDKA